MAGHAPRRAASIPLAKVAAAKNGAGADAGFRICFLFSPLLCSAVSRLLRCQGKEGSDGDGTPLHRAGCLVAASVPAMFAFA